MNESTIFDWQNMKSFCTRFCTSLQWVAVRTPCDVAVHPIQDGPQIILLYSLVVSERIGGLLFSKLSLSQTIYPEPSHYQCPLHRNVKNLTFTRNLLIAIFSISKRRVIISPATYPCQSSRTRYSILPLTPLSGKYWNARLVEKLYGRR
jgi:hypothetical protein